MEEKYYSNLKQNTLGFFEKIEKQKKNKRDNNYFEGYSYENNQPKNVKIIELTKDGYIPIENYSNKNDNYDWSNTSNDIYKKYKCPNEPKQKGVWIGIL